ncbi:MAG: hypothetical protein IRZ15_07265 [Bryobacteraceae bacterium]|nr:hypothetical protein [Bryobacteraceae bacterium]
MAGIAAIDTQASNHRGRRNRRLISAWSASLLSKGATFVAQIFAVPIVYRSLDGDRFAAYAAVTSAASVLGSLNLGLGGALVNPVVKAVTEGDQKGEARTVVSAVLPLVVLAVAAGLILLPYLVLGDLSPLFGPISQAVGESELRIAALVACSATLASIPMSAVENLRQAYQEAHINSLIGAGWNIFLSLGLFAAAWLHPTLPVFVAVMVLTPAAARYINAVSLFRKRPYLLANPSESFCRPLAARLTHDGLIYLAAAFSHVLLYQWPIYLLTRLRPPSESPAYIVCIQFVLLAVSFTVGLVQPLWGAVSEARARSDAGWLVKALRTARIAVLIYGVAILAGFGLFGETVLRLWVRRPIVLDPYVTWAAGLYILLATWEYVHFTFSLGLGALRPASLSAFGRAVFFAAVAPAAIATGGAGFLFLSLCASVAVTTGWLYPRMIRGRLASLTQ